MTASLQHTASLLVITRYCDRLWTHHASLKSFWRICLVRLTSDIMVSHINLLFIRARHFSQVWDPLMVTIIFLARRQGDILSSGSPSDFISHSTGRLYVRNKLTLWEQGSLSRSQALLSWSQAVPSTFICYNIRLHSYTFVYSCWRIEAYFRFLSLNLTFEESRL